MGDRTDDSVVAIFQRGELHLQTGQLQAAEQDFRQAIALSPNFAEAHANLGYVLSRLGNSAEAESHYRRALEISPDHATVHLNLGALLAQQKRHTDAEASYAAALALDPQSSAVWSNLGTLNLNLKREETAEACLRHAIELDPSNARARFNLAYQRLRHGDFEEGWALFESRDWYRAMGEKWAFPQWRGESLVGRSLLVTDQAGHGDVIHFCRYIPLLKARGAAHITLQCHPALKRLMGGLIGLDGICSFDEVLPQMQFDFWIPLMSAPYHLATRSDTVPAQLPYLQAPALLRAQWGSQWPHQGGMRVGLVWRGNPQFENDSDRSLPNIQTLAPLWSVPDVHFFSLQKGAGEGEIATCRAHQPLLDLGSRMQDFADAAAIVADLDMVITVDTATAHLAGALGKTCWLLLPWYMTDWRWGISGTHSIWYPGVMRLFRQGPDADWGPVIADVVVALMERIAPQHAPSQ